MRSKGGTALLGDYMSTITAIEYQKNNKNKVNLYVDGEFKCGLTAETAVVARLKKGQELSEEKLTELLTTSEAQIAFDKSLNCISKSGKTAYQVKQYLVQKGFAPQAADSALQKLKDYKYVDDEQYAVQYVAQGKPTKGAVRLKQELMLKGVEKSVIEQALSALDQEETEQNALRVAEKFLKNKPLDVSTAAKINRHLLGRGFDYETAGAVLEILRQKYSSQTDD